MQRQGTPSKALVKGVAKTMMTTEEIQTEFGWCEDKIRALLRFPDSIKTRRRHDTHMSGTSCIAAIERWLPPRLQRAGSPKGSGTRLNVVIDLAQVGQLG
jgi:hypothetical protein